MEVMQLVVCADDGDTTVAPRTRTVYASVSDPAAQRRSRLRLANDLDSSPLHPRILCRVVTFS